MRGHEVFGVEVEQLAQPDHARCIVDVQVLRPREEGQRLTRQFGVERGRMEGLARQRRAGARHAVERKVHPRLAERTRERSDDIVLERVERHRLATDDHLAQHKEAQLGEPAVALGHSARNHIGHRQCVVRIDHVRQTLLRVGEGVERRVGDMAQHAIEIAAIGSESREVHGTTPIDVTIEHARPRGFGLGGGHCRHGGRRDHGGATCQRRDAKRDQASADAANHGACRRSARAAARVLPLRNLIGNTATSPAARLLRPASGCQVPSRGSDRLQQVVVAACVVGAHAHRPVLRHHHEHAGVDALAHRAPWRP